MQHNLLCYLKTLGYLDILGNLRQMGLNKKKQLKLFYLTLNEHCILLRSFLILNVLSHLVYNKNLNFLII